MRDYDVCVGQKERSMTGPLDSKPLVERHYLSRIGWLRAAVLGANDGLLSTSSLVVGVAAAAIATQQVVLTAVAGLVAGSMAMAAGEFVSVSSQADAEEADLARERGELADDPEQETRELTAIYIRRGLDHDLAEKVAVRLMEHDALGAHVRDELGIHEHSSARPVQAALASAAAFALGSVPPLLTAMFTPRTTLVPTVSVLALVVLSFLGAAGAKAGGAPVLRAVLRVVFWGALAMAVTAGVGRLFQVQVG
jgi:vacuolar iron transporter family protein